MDFFTWIIVGSIAVYVLKGIEHRRRVRLLGAHLAPTQVEKLMGGLIEGYMRALDEKDEERRKQVWAILDNSEKTLADQLQRLADSFAKENAEDTRVSVLPLALPYFDQCQSGRSQAGGHCRVPPAQGQGRRNAWRSPGSGGPV